VIVVAIAGAMAAFLAGCGGDEDPGKSDGAVKNGVQGTSPKDPPASGEAPDPRLTPKDTGEPDPRSDESRTLPEELLRRKGPDLPDPPVREATQLPQKPRGQPPRSATDSGFSRGAGGVDEGRTATGE